MKKLVLLAFLLPGLMGFAQNRWEYRLSKGEVYHVGVHDDRNWVLEHNGKPVVVTFATEAQLDLTITAARNRSYEVEGVCRKLSLRVRSDAPGGGEILFNSSDLSTDASSRTLKLVTGRPFTFTMSKKGDLTRFSGLDKAFADAVASHTHLPDTIQQALKSQLMDAFSDAEMRNMLQLYTHIYPESTPSLLPSHGKNDSAQTGWLRWTVASRVTRPIGFNMVMSYFANDKATRTIDGRGELKLDFDRREWQPGGVSTQIYDLYGTLKAEVDTDLKTGWSLKTKIIQDLAGHQIVKGRNKETSKTPQKMHRETVYELSKPAPVQ